jgi:hypothetical protein
MLERTPASRYAVMPAAADLDLQARLAGAAADHAICVDPVHRRGGEHAGLPDRRAEEGTLPSSWIPSATVFIDEVRELVICGHLVALAAFLVEPQPPDILALFGRAQQEIANR